MPLAVVGIQPLFRCVLAGYGEPKWRFLSPTMCHAPAGMCQAGGGAELIHFQRKVI